MTLRILYNGVEWTDTVTRFRGPIPGVTSKGDGTFATGQATLRDPTGVLTYLHLQTIRLVEDLCVTAPILFDGSIYNIHVDRGDYATGPGRVYTFSFTDLNGLLHDGVFRTASAKRPAETGDARMAWFLSTAPIAGVVYDNGLVAANPWNFDEADYRGRYPDEVLQDLSVSSVSEVGRIFYVYMDQATQQPSLFIDAPSAASRVSSLAVSNVPGDYDGITTFQPLPGPSLDSAGEGIYCGVWFTTKNGSIYRHSATTHATYFGTSSRHRDGTFSTDRISLGETAERHALAWLAKHSGPTETVSLIVRVPRDKVGLISAGERLPTRLEHLPGYEAGVNIRVASVTFPVDPGILDHYDLQLELSNRGIFGVAGGNPGAFPHVPVAPSIVQQSPAATSTLVMPGPITPGNTLVVVTQGLLYPGAGSWDYLAAGYTAADPLTVPGGSIGFVYKTAGAAESTSQGIGGNNRGVWYELPGTWTPGVYDENSAATATGNGIVMTAGPVTVSASSIAFALGWIGSGGTFASVSGTLSFTPGAGMTEDADLRNVPNVWIGHAFPAAGSLTAQTTNSANVPSPNTPGYLYAEDVPWAMRTVDFTGSVSNPPSPGQWVYDEVVSMAGAVGTLDYPFADGSLTVKVDLLDQTDAITAQDGVAGTFTLGFTPGAGEVVTATYQGR